MGIPVVAEGEAHYSPIRLLLAVLLSAPASFMAEVALYFALVGLGAYLFLRAIRLHPLAASAGALGFMFGSNFVIELRDMGLLQFQWLMWAAEMSFREGRLKRIFWMAPPLFALQYLAGNPVYSVISLLALWLYLILRAVTSWTLRILSAWTAMTGLGLGMAAVQIIPTLRHVNESVRAGGPSLEYATQYNYSKPADFPHAFFSYASMARESLRPFLPLAVLIPMMAAAFWVTRPAMHDDGLRNGGLAGLLAQDPDRFRFFSLFLPPDNKPSEFREQNALIGSTPPLWGLDSVKYHGSLELRRFERVTQGLTSILRTIRSKRRNLVDFSIFWEQST
jgi:hypothetical protein